MVAQAFNPSTWDVEAGGFLWVQDQPGLQSKFQNKLQSYTGNPCLRKQNQTKNVIYFKLATWHKSWPKAWNMAVWIHYLSSQCSTELSHILAWHGQHPGVNVGDINDKGGYNKLRNNFIRVKCVGFCYQKTWAHELVTPLSNNNVSLDLGFSICEWWTWNRLTSAVHHWAWWHMPLIPAFKRRRQADLLSSRSA